MDEGSHAEPSGRVRWAPQGGAARGVSESGCSRKVDSHMTRDPPWLLSRWGGKPDSLKAASESPEATESICGCAPQDALSRCTVLPLAAVSRLEGVRVMSCSAARFRRAHLPLGLNGSIMARPGPLHATPRAGLSQARRGGHGGLHELGNKSFDFRARPV
jgi:hypothetical protein